MYFTFSFINTMQCDMSQTKMLRLDKKEEN